MVLRYFFTALVFVLSYGLFSQNTGTPIIKTHYYTFQGNANQQQLDKLEQVLMRIEFVSEAKVKYKPEKNMGQIIFITKEFETVKEGDRTFSPTSVKQAILQNGLMPMQYSIPQTN